jgi:hypothetical protein
MVKEFHIIPGSRYCYCSTFLASNTRSVSITPWTVLIVLKKPILEQTEPGPTAA